MNKLFVILASAVLLFASAAFAQEKAVPTDTTVAQANFNAPSASAPAALGTAPKDGAGATTTTPVEGKLVVPTELASAKVSTAATFVFPDTLKGNWVVEPHRMYGNTLSFRTVNGEVLFTWWKLKSVGCSVKDAPVQVKAVDGMFEISLRNYECMKEFDATLEKSGNGFKMAGKMVTDMGGGKFSATLQ